MAMTEENMVAGPDAMVMDAGGRRVTVVMIVVMPMVMRVTVGMAMGVTV